jgi:nitrogen fixation NifU-like protein
MKTLVMLVYLTKMQNVGTGMVGAPACGDVMRLQIQVNDEGVIEEARFKTYGCGSAIASSSLVTEWLKGKTLDEAQAIKNIDIATELALPPVKSLFCIGRRCDQSCD